MERSQNFYGLFVMYRYACVDVTVIDSTFVVFIQTCLQSYSALYRFSVMTTYYFILLKCKLHRFLWLLLNVIGLVLVATDYSAKLTSINHGCLYHLRDIVRENRAVAKDRGQPISFIFSAFKTKLIRLTLVTLARFPGVSLPRLTTPLVFCQGKP